MQRKSSLLSGLALLLGLSTGCASTSFPQDARAVSEIVNAHHQPPLAVDATLAHAAAADSTENELQALLEKPLDADRAMRVALSENRNLRAALQELGLARGALVQASLLPNPEIDLGVRRATDPTQPLQVDIGLEYDISRLVLLPLRKSAAEAHLASERVRVAQEVLDTAYRARTALYAVVARKQAQKLRAEALASFQAAFVAAEELHRIGNLPDLDLAANRAAVETARIELLEADNAVLDAQENLHIALGLPAKKAPVGTEDALADPPAELGLPENLEKRALAASLELQHIRAQEQAASRRAGLLQVEGALPHLSGGFHGEHDGFSWEIGGHLTLGLPIFDRQQGRVLSARAEVAVERERFQAAETALRATLRTARNRVESTWKRARHYRDVVLPAREKAVDETVLQYNAMQVGVFQVLEAQRKVTQSSLAYIETLHAYWVARAALDQILAGRHQDLGLGLAQGPSPSLSNDGPNQEPAH